MYRGERGKAAAARQKRRESWLLVALALVYLPALLVAVDKTGVAPSTDACTVTDRRKQPQQYDYERRCGSRNARGLCSWYFVERVPHLRRWELVVAWPEPGGKSATLLVSEEVGHRVFERDTIWVQSRGGRFSGHHYDARFGGRR